MVVLVRGPSAFRSPYVPVLVVGAVMDVAGAVMGAVGVRAASRCAGPCPYPSPCAPVHVGADVGRAHVVGLRR